QVDSPRWRRAWDVVIVLSSYISPLVVGLILTLSVFGMPLNAIGDRVGPWYGVFTGPAVLGAVAVCAFSVLHGAVFLALKTEGEVRERAHRLAVYGGVPLLAPVVALALW